MKVLSLFDGMACGMLAMQAAGITVDRYVAFEIDKYAVQTSSNNFPMIEHRGDVFQADFTEFQGFDFLVGGSPCTYWSIAQKNNRETEASGMGWELFSQYVRALREAQPMYFIYENNKSMSKAIRESITKTFGFEPVCINSALVSAQNRQRLYWVGKRNLDGTYSQVHVEQPEDRGILLRDVLDCAFPYGETNGKAFALTASYWKGQPKDKILDKSQRTHVAEPVRIPAYGLDEKARCLTASYAYKGSGAGSLISEAFPDNPNKQVRDYIAEPVNVTEDGKSQTLKAQYFKNSVANFCCYSSTYGASGVAEPVCLNSKSGRGGVEGLQPSLQDRIYSLDGKHTAVTTGFMPKIAVPIKVGEVGNGGRGNRIYSVEGKSVAQTAQSGGMGSNTGLYAIAIEFDGDVPVKAISGSDGKTYTVYEVKDGQITIKGKQYPIKLVDGYYIIRKLTVSECKRLQTVPEWYEFPVSDTQAYKMLGNGWTVLVIAHLIIATQIIDAEDFEEEYQLNLFEMVGV